MIELQRTAIFTKRPEPGRAKTRLCPPLSTEEAAELARAMLCDAVERAVAAGLRPTVFFAPDDARAWFEREFPRLSDLRPQRGQGLGERLAAGFDELFREGARSVVALGSDQPLVVPRQVREAHARLAAGADLVLAPDGGGGYVLVGLAAARPEVFTSVEMSSARTCAETVELARRAGLSLELFEPGLDVDVAEDLERLRVELERWRARGGERDPDFPRHTDRRLRELARAGA